MKDGLMQMMRDMDALIQENRYRVDHVEYHPRGDMLAVYCKRCGAPIRIAVTGADGRATLNTLANYCEINILCTDGSNHVTHCCKDCAIGLSLDTLDDFLLIDTYQMFKESIEQGHQIPESFGKMMITRRAVGRA